MNVLEARRRLLDGEIKKRTAEGENISVRSVSRMRPGLTLYGKSEQETTTGAQLVTEENQQFSMEFVRGADVNDSLHEIPIQVNGQFEYPGYISFVCDIDIPFPIGITACSAEGTWGTTSAKNVQKGFNQAEIKAITSGENPVLIQIRAYSSPTENITISVSDVFVKSGSTALPWEQYTGGAPSPSPDYPQEIKSVGDSGAINVTLSDGGSQSQTLPVQTPNGLPGIPVNSGGNYTDADGQQWICDEVDFERGVYVQRVHVINAKNRSWNDSWNLVFPDETGKTHVFNVSTMEYAISQHAMSNVFFNRDIANSANVNVFTTDQGNGGIGVRVYSQLASTLEEWNAYINSHDVIFALALKEQNYVETPLSPSELSAYAALRTYSPTTVVSNNAGAWMKLGYKTKKSLEVTD